MDVCLVYMPYGPIETPPLGMALLVAEAKRAGLSARAMYPAFRFAEEIGYFHYKALSMAMGGFHVCEWTFAGVAFPAGHSDDGDDFLEKVAEWERRNDPEKYRLIFKDEASFKNSCLKVRDAAEAFVEEQAAKILELSPKVVGCSSSYYQNCASLAVLRELKHLNPGIITLMGGTNCESSMGTVISKAFPWVDFVVSGEADELFAPFCRKLLEKGRTLSMDEIPFGVLSGGGNEEPLSLGAEPPVAIVGNLDDLPRPDFDDYLHEREGFAYNAALPRLSLSVETSRGCWWGQRGQCSFCGGNGKRIGFRVKKPARFLRELDELHACYGIHDFVATDNILDMSYFKTVLPELASTCPPRYSFFCSTKSNLGEEHCRRMADAGIYRFQPGIESLHDDMLRILNKGNKAIDHVALLKFAHENGIKANWNILTDIPGERQEWYLETASWLPLIVHLQPPHKVMSIHFDRFSPYHRNPERFGLNLVPGRWYSLIYPLSSEQIEAFACRFENRPEQADRQSEGRDRLKRVLGQWKMLHSPIPSRPNPPTLTVREEESCSVVVDTRPCALSEIHVLKGVHDWVYRACRSPVSLEDVVESVNFAGKEATVKETVQDALEYLRQQKFLLCIDGLYLALALKEPLRPFPNGPAPSTTNASTILEARGMSYWNALERLDRRPETGGR